MLEAAEYFLAPEDRHDFKERRAHRATRQGHARRMDEVLRLEIPFGDERARRLLNRCGVEIRQAIEAIAQLQQTLRDSIRA